MSDPDPLAGVDLGPDPLSGIDLTADAARHHAGQVVSNLGRAAANTFGVGDNLVAGWRTILPAMYPSVFGGNASGPIAKDEATMGSQFEAARAEERAKTAASNEALGPVYSTAANMVGGLPAGLLGAGAGATRALASTRVGPWLSRLIVGGGEGLGMNLMGDTGRGETPTPGNMALSTLLGAGFNSLGGRPAGKPPAMPARDVLEANKAKALTDLEAPRFNPAHVTPAWDNARAALDGSQRAALSNDMELAVAKQKAENISNGQAGTPASVINGFSRNIFDNVRTKADNVYAAKIRDNLIDGPTGILATNTPITGHQVGEAARLNNAFMDAHAALGDHDWLANTNINKAPAEAAAKINDPRMRFTPEGRESVQNLAALAPKPTIPSTNPLVAGVKAAGSSLWGDLSNKAVPAVVALSGYPVSAAGMSGVKAAGAGAGAMWNAGSNAAKQRAIDAALVATGTGARTPPIDMQPAAPVRRLIGALGTGVEAKPPDPWAAYSP